MKGFAHSLAILSSIIFLISSCTKESEKQKSHVIIEKPEVGFRAPAFTILSLDGKKISLSDITSDVIVLNFWFTMCPPCIDEMPHLKALQEKFDPKKVRVILLAADLQRNVERFIAGSYKAPLVALDVNGVAQKYKVEKFPETFILDKKRIIIEKYSGYQEWNAPRFAHYFQALLVQ